MFFGLFACCVSCWRGDQQGGQYDHAKHKRALALRYRHFSLPQSSSVSRLTAGCIRLSPIGQALATEAIAECIRSGSLSEAESNIKLLGLVSTPPAADRDASVTVERINL
jgi:hypothetical protein